MFSMASNSGNIAYGVARLLVDTEEDVGSLPTYHTPGSTAFVIATSSRYMLNNQKQWVKVHTGSNSGGSSDTDVQIGMFSCSFTNGAVTPDSINGISYVSGTDGTQGADVTALVAYFSALANIETIKIEVAASNSSSSITGESPTCALYFNTLDNAAAVSGILSNGVVTLSATVPDGASAVILKPYHFNDNAGTITFSLRVSATLKETESTEDVIYDGGLI